MVLWLTAALASLCAHSPPARVRNGWVGPGGSGPGGVP